MADQTNELAMAAQKADFPLAKAATFGQAMLLAKTLAASGMFKDARQEKEAFAKIAIGMDLGISPTEALRSLHVVQGKPTLDYALIGSLIKRHPSYDYKVREASATVAKIEFFERGESIGVSEFTMDQAVKAGLAGKDIWKAYPQNMLFARAMSNGARMFAPDVFGGAVYAEGEIEAETSEHRHHAPMQAEPVQDAEVIEAEVVPERVENQPEPEPEPKPDGTRAKQPSAQTVYLRDTLRMSDDGRKAFVAQCKEAGADPKQVIAELQAANVDAKSYGAQARADAIARAKGEEPKPVEALSVEQLRKNMPSPLTPTGGGQ